MNWTMKLMHAARMSPLRFYYEHSKCILHLLCDTDVAMDMRTFTTRQLVDNIRLIVGDSSFKSRLEKASKVFASDRQLPSERAAFWIEHVCQFGGNHLRSGGSDLSEFEYFMVDIAIVVLLVVGATFFCLYLTVVACYNLVSKRVTRMNKKIKEN